MRLPCVFCKDGAGKAGKLLKCLHKICLDCLPARTQQDGRIRCAKCRITTPRPPPVSSHEQLLVDDSMFERIPMSHDRAKKADEKCDDLQIVAPEIMKPFSAPSESTSSDVTHSTEVEGESHSKKTSHLGGVLFCPNHMEMEMRLYCTQCREV
eukprot:scpid103967/ scgid21757/ 